MGLRGKKVNVKLYRAMKINDKWEVVSNEVLYERSLYTNGNVSGIEYIIHQQDSPDGSVSILKAIACYTKEEAIIACCAFLEAKIDNHRQSINAIKLEMGALKEV